MIDENTSPGWNAQIKLVVALTLLAIVAGLLIKFESIVPPLIIVVILAYLISPVARFLSRQLHIPWKLAVGLIYGLVIILLLVGLTLGGVGLLQQSLRSVAISKRGLQQCSAGFGCRGPLDH